MKNVFVMTKEDCNPNIDVNNIDLENQIVVIKLDHLTEKYQEAKYQLVKCTGGFGCSPTARGNAIFVQELFEGGEYYRRERCNRDFIGVATEEAIKEWRRVYGN